MNRVETTDPITGRDIHDVTGKPFVAQQSGDDKLTIYFESDESKQQFLDIPVQHPIEHRLNLDNPTDIMIDEG